MRVHFMAAVDGDKDDYAKIIGTIEKMGNEVITRHYLERNIKDIVNETPEESELYVKKIAMWMKKADVVVFETTKPDVSVGFEVATALNYMKPVIVLYRQEKGFTPHSLKGMSNEKLQVLSYNQDTVEELLKLALEYAQETTDTRFNFFISPSLSHYLDWVAQTKKIPRSVYLRQLIEQDREENKEYYES